MEEEEKAAAGLHLSRCNRFRLLLSAEEGGRVSLTLVLEASSAGSAPQT